MKSKLGILKKNSSNLQNEINMKLNIKPYV